MVCVLRLKGLQDKQVGVGRVVWCSFRGFGGVMCAFPHYRRADLTMGCGAWGGLSHHIQFTYYPLSLSFTPNARPAVEAEEGLGRGNPNKPC